MRAPDTGQTAVIGGALLLATAALPFWLVGVAAQPALLAFAPLVLAPPPILAGYDVRVLRAGLRGDEAAPSFVRWRGLLADGIRALAVDAWYLLPAALPPVAAATALWVWGRLIAPPGLWFASLAALAGVALALGYGLVFLYVRPAARAVLAHTGRVRSALDPRRTAAMARSGDYAAGRLLGGAVWLACLALAGPFVPFVVGCVPLFSARLVANSLAGRGAATALEARAAESRPRSAPIEEQKRPGADPSSRGDRSTEAPAAVQTGRTVGAFDRRSGSGPDAEPLGTDGAGRTERGAGADRGGSEDARPDPAIARRPSDRSGAERTSGEERADGRDGRESTDGNGGTDGGDGRESTDGFEWVGDG